MIKVIFIPLLIFSIIIAQKMKVYTSEGVKSFDLAEIDSITFVQSNKGLIAHYQFNGDANDATGKNPGTVHGATPIVDRKGKANSALEFDGKDDFIEIPSHSSLDIKNQITISFWINAPKKLPNMIIYKGPFNDRPQNSGSPIGINVSTTDDIIFDLYDTKAVHHRAQNKSMRFTENKWNFIVCTYDGKFMRIFENGTKIAETSGEFSINTVDQPLWIGKYHFIRINETLFFQGKLDDIRIYNRAIDESEVKSLYNFYG